MKEITNMWPAMLITGEKVTEEQAMDIIIRTDEAVVTPNIYTFGNNQDFGKQWAKLIDVRYDYDESVYSRLECINFVSLEYLYNSLLGSCWMGGSTSWIWEDGSIFRFSNIGKWPSTEEVFDELKRIAQAFPYLKLKVTLFDEQVMPDFYISGQKIANAAYEDVLDKALCSFTVKNGDVTYHNEPFEDHFSRDLIPESFNKKNLFISGCYVSNVFLEKLRGEVVKRLSNGKSTLDWNNDHQGQ